MKSLFAKILLAQVVAVVLGLLVVMFIARFSLDRGFINFLERQEGAVLGYLAPALGDLYSAQGGWGFLHGHPENWHQILRRTRHMSPSVGEGGPFRERLGLREQAPDGAPPPFTDERLRWLRSFDRLRLRDRLFLLDEHHQPLAGAHVDHPAELPLEAVLADGRTVGWIGFAPVRRDLPPEAHRFMRGQLRAHLVALGAALVLVAMLGYALARHLSRPVRQLDETVSDLSRGQFNKRADVSSRDEIGRLAQNVNRLAETLEKNRSARHRWMADIAHELRTPIAILKGEIEALGDGVRQPDEKTFSSLSEEINHLSVLVDDLQSLALADAGALNLNQQPVELRELAEQVCASFRERLKARGIGLELVAPEPVTVSADAQRLRQLLNNLLENCLRYVEDGGRVRVVLSGHAEGAELAVEDSGPGVDTAQLAKLFERFYRGGQGRSRAGGGSGLGLAICRSIAEAHGGDIRADHSAHGGLGIYLTLP